MAAAMLLATGVSAAGWAAERSDGRASEHAEEILEAMPFFAGEGQGRYRMVVEGRSGDRYERTFVVERKKIRGTVHTRLKVLSPEDLSGRVYLFVDKKGNDGAGAYWVWVPAFEETRQIEGAQRDGSLLRSHLTYRDILGVRSADEDSVQLDADGDTFKCTVSSKEGSDETTFDVASWEGKGAKVRVTKMTIRPSTGGYTRLELLDFQPDVSSKKRAFLPEGFGTAGEAPAGR
jgi:hypothetical protein